MKIFSISERCFIERQEFLAYIQIFLMPVDVKQKGNTAGSERVREGGLIGHIVFVSQKLGAANFSAVETVESTLNQDVALFEIVLRSNG